MHHDVLAAPTRAARALLVVVGVAVLLAVTAVPAHAHGRGSDATNMASRILEDPGLPGVTWAIHGGDELLEVVNETDREIVILGYASEPYLRVGPDGVFENRNSEATYINRERQGMVDLPPGIDTSAEPEWVQVSDAGTAAWHDHRIHYMGTGTPPSVTDEAVETVVIERWTVPFDWGDERYEVAGDLRWIPGTSPFPWLLVGLLLTLPALLGLRTRPLHAPGEPESAPPQSWPGLARPAAVVLGVVVALNLTHLVDDLFAMPLAWSVRGLAAGQTALFLAIGAFGAWRAWQAGDGAFTALGVGSVAVLIGQGLLYLDVLAVSQISSLFPDLLARVTVGASIAQVLPLAIVVVIGTRRLLPPLPEEEEVPRSEAPELQG